MEEEARYSVKVRIRASSLDRWYSKTGFLGMAIVQYFPEPELRRRKQDPVTYPRDVVWLDPPEGGVLSEKHVEAARQQAEVIPEHRGIVISPKALGIRVHPDKLVEVESQLFGMETAIRNEARRTGIVYECRGAPSAISSADIAKYFRITPALVGKLVREAQNNPERNKALITH